MPVTSNTEERILRAARNVFTTKGYAGARMQDIADEAEINKAMLHYYFRNKKKLFEMIFKEQFAKLMSAFQTILSSDQSLKEKLKDMIHREFELLSTYPDLPLFVLHEINKDPALIQRALQDKPVDALLSGFEASIQNAVEKGAIRSVDPKHLFINIMSLCIYPFIAKPMIKSVMQFSEEEYRQFLNLRPALLTGLIWKSLSPK